MAGQLQPIDHAAILDSVSATSRLVVVEEGSEGWSWGSGVVERVCADGFHQLSAPPRVLASAPDIIPSDRGLESERLVTEEDIERVIREVAS